MKIARVRKQNETEEQKNRKQNYGA